MRSKKVQERMPKASSAGSSAYTRTPTERQPLPNRLVRLLSEARWLALAVLGLYFVLILISYDKMDPGWSHETLVPKVHNLGGRAGAWLSDLLLYIFGFSAWWWAFCLLRIVWLGYRRLTQKYVLSKEPDPEHAQEPLIRGIGFVLLFIGSVGLEYLRMYSLHVQLPRAPGGVLGQLIGHSSHVAFGFTCATLLLLLLFGLVLSLFFHVSWLTLAERIGGGIEMMIDWFIQRYQYREDRRQGEVAAVKREEVVVIERAKHVEKHPVAAPPVKIEPQVVTVIKSERVEKERQANLFQDLSGYSRLPALSLLDEAAEVQETVSIETLEFTSRLIEKKLSDFGVEAKVVAAYPGPVVTRYEIEPATGVKGSQIVGLARDLARSLSLTSIRVVETIPGKNYMALELPNAKRQIVRLTEILGSKVYNDGVSSLTIALGKDIAGKPVVADLAKMPHLLVAGTTGSGKSVGINATILSLLYKSTPAQVRLLMIDPKMLELSTYEGIPHLLAPVVTDMREAGHALNWCVAEMDRRYRLLSKMGVRGLSGYNQKIKEAIDAKAPLKHPFTLTPDDPELLEPLPLLVVVIDELADLMMVSGKKVEELIARLAQKSRACGIHLILATQRPSVDVITGLIKANVPTRIAFQVSAKVDSRTILDQQGAESLLGQGDMLYLTPGHGIPTRVHGAYVGDAEVHRVVESLKKQGETKYIDGILDEPDAAEGTSGEGAVSGEADP